jgi:hypothetical protein
LQHARGAVGEEPAFSLSERRAAAYILGMSPVADGCCALRLRNVFSRRPTISTATTLPQNEELRRLIDAAIDPATRTSIWSSAGAEVDATTLGSIAGTPPMMAERRAVVVREVNALRRMRAPSSIRT